LNNLQKLLKLRGLTIKEVARQIGYGYHMTQKVINRTPYKHVGDTHGVYASRDIEAAVAKLLGLEYDQVWGPASRITLHQLIKEELKKQAKSQEEKLFKHWLNGNYDKITGE
jgi:transcriptional regulator with XRE-family HTH domain